MDHPSAIEKVLTATMSFGTGEESEYLLADDVVLLKVWDGSSRLLDLNGQSFGLPAVSTTLLEATLQVGPAAAADGVARRYGIPAEPVRADLQISCATSRGAGCRCAGEGIPAGPRTWPVCWTGPWPGPSTSPCEWSAQDSVQVWLLLGLAHVCLWLRGWARTVKLWAEGLRQGGRLGRSNP